MIEPIPFEPDRFRSAAAHYLAGRSPYPPALIDRVATIVGLEPAHRVLDLGCGPGQLAIAFSPLVSEVVGLDPGAAMLAEAMQAGAGLANVRFREGSSYDLGPEMGRFFLVTMGRSFHWMDRADTLRRLDGMIEPGGAVALFHDTRVDIPENGWYAKFSAVLDRHAAAGGRSSWRGPDWVRHEAVLLESPFSRLETMGVVTRRRVPVGDLIDRALSLSSTSRAAIGDQADAMVAELTTLFAEIAPDGGVSEVSHSIALMAFRP